MAGMAFTQWVLLCHIYSIVYDSDIANVHVGVYHYTSKMSNSQWLSPRLD